MKNKAYAVVVLGPTAIGKTDLVVSLFEGRGEVISADSMQIYSGMDIGTAKPSEEVRRRLPHHLIGELKPDRQYTLGDFVRAAERLVLDLSGRGLVPVVCGGTAFYLRGLLFGLPPTPPGDPGVRRGLEERLAEQGLARLYGELLRLDPQAASKISPKDRYRILRALEVMTVTSRPLSAHAVPQLPREDLDFLVLGLVRDRDDLNRRIDRRVGAMFNQGLVAEVKALMEEYGPEAPGMRALGYREFFTWKDNPCLTLGGVQDLLRRNTRRYAKRQITFFKTFPGVRWFDVDRERAGLEAAVEAFLRPRFQGP